MELTTKKAGFRLMVNGINFRLRKYPRTTFTYKDILNRQRSKIESGWGMISEDGEHQILRKSDLNFRMTKIGLQYAITADDYIIAVSKQQELKAQSSKEHPYRCNMLCPHCSSILREIHNRWTYAYVCPECGYKHY